MSLLIATESFSGPGSDGAPYLVVAGQTYTSDHPAVRGREHLFRNAEEMATGGRELPADHLRQSSGPATASETADATPGKRRSRTVPN